MITLRFHSNEDYNWYLTKVLTTGNETSLVLPDYVVKNYTEANENKELKVNYGIYKYAFANSTITSLTILSSINSILAYAFADSNIDTIICRRKTPPSIATEAFNGLTKTITIYIPIGSSSNYQTVLWNRISELKLPNGDKAINIVENVRATPPLENKINPLYWLNEGNINETIKINKDIKAIGRMAFYSTFPNSFTAIGTDIEDSVIEIENQALLDNSIIIKAFESKPSTSIPGGGTSGGSGGSESEGDNPGEGGGNESGGEDTPPSGPPEGTIYFNIVGADGITNSYSYQYYATNLWGDFVSANTDKGFSIDQYGRVVFSITSIIVDPDTETAVSANDPIIDGKTYIEMPQSN